MCIFLAVCIIIPVFMSIRCTDLDGFQLQNIIVCGLLWVYVVIYSTGKSRRYADRRSCNPISVFACSSAVAGLRKINFNITVSFGVSKDISLYKNMA